MERENIDDAAKPRAACASLRKDWIEIVCVHDADRILAFRRWTDLEELLVVVSLNNHPFEDAYRFEHPTILAGKWQTILNSDSSLYGGTSEAVLASQRAESQDGHVEIAIPANAILVLKRYE